MAYKVHQAQYHFGDGILRPDQRIVVGTRPRPKEPRRVAKHLGLKRMHPKRLIRHDVFADGDYLPTFLAKECPSERFTRNYLNGAWGQGLRGNTVYIVHTFSRSLTPQDLEKRVEIIADTAKYNGAEAVVLLAYTLNHSAQERGVHDKDHPRMQSEEKKKRYDGQAPTLRTQLKHYLTAGVDAIITPHIHDAESLLELTDCVNEEFAPLAKRAREHNCTMRYRLKTIHVDLAPLLAHYLRDKSPEYLQFNTSDGGRNILIACPDEGIASFGRRVHKQSGLPNAALAVMAKEKSPTGNIEQLCLKETINLDPTRGIEDMDVFVVDDVIRTGRTMEANLRVLAGINGGTVVRDPRIKGRPRRIAVYATRTNFSGDAVDRLSESDVIDDVAITNADARAWADVGELDANAQQLWINFMMGAAAKAAEQGLDPNTILTPDYIRDNKLLFIGLPHGHRHTIVDDDDGIL